MFEKIKGIFKTEPKTPKVVFEPIPKKESIKTVSPIEIENEEISFDDIIASEQTEVGNEELKNENVPIAYINYDIPSDVAKLHDRLNTTTVYNGENVTYKYLIDKFSAKWGVSPILLTAMMSRESKIDNNANKDGLMQIVASQNRNEFKVYNFTDKKWETIVLTNNSNNYPSDYICVSDEELRNPVTNISIGAALLAYTANNMGNNIPLAIQGYNFGYPKLKEELGSDKLSYFINNDTGVEFINEIQNHPEGDTQYLRNILGYLDVYNYGERTDNVITFKHMEGNKEVEKSIIFKNK